MKYYMNIKNKQVAVMKILHSFIDVSPLGVNVPFFARLGIVIQFLVKPTRNLLYTFVNFRMFSCFYKIVGIKHIYSIVFIFLFPSVAFALPQPIGLSNIYMSLPDTLKADSLEYYKMWNLQDVVVVGSKVVITHKPGSITYIIKNDPYAKGLNGLEAIQRVPRVSQIGDAINVAGKNSVRYIIDGKLLEASDAESLVNLKNLRAEDIDRIELLTVPPSKYPADANVAYISIKMKNDKTLGIGGNLDANLILKEHVNSSLGVGLRQAAKKVDYSVNLNYYSTKGINDLYREYTFSDHTKSSKRHNTFNNDVYNVNTLLKYRPLSTVELGTIVNYYSEHLRSYITDETIDRNTKYQSFSTSPSKPNHATSATAFCDWTLAPNGKMLSLTYNYFNKHTVTSSLISTITNVSDDNLKSDGNNDYKIHSLKLDATLPFSWMDIEAGAAYTSIRNTTAMDIFNQTNDDWLVDDRLSNHFNYSEKTSALYISLSRHLLPQLFAKVGVRYEHTAIKGLQINTDERMRQSYGKLFPTFNVDYNNNNGLGISASYSIGIDRPRFLDLNPFRYYTTTTDYNSGNAYLSASTTHNAELNVSYKGLYAVLYDNQIRNGIGYVTFFNDDNSQYSIPQNHIEYSKYGLYVSYQKNLTSWLNIKAGSELFYARSKSNLEGVPLPSVEGWSGKLEGSADIAFNKPRTILFNMSYTHMFPYNEELAKYKSIILLNANIRYVPTNGKFQLMLSVNDPFMQNITTMTKVYSTYSEYSRNNVHARNVSLKFSYRFGGNKLKDVYRDNKESESNRSF